MYSVKIWIKRLAVVLILSGVAAIWATLTIIEISLGILVAWIPILAGVVLYQWASLLEQAHRSGDKERLLSCVSKLSSCFKALGVSATLTFLVVSVFLIFLTAAPHLVRNSLQVRNESGAVSNLRTINTAQVTYVSSNGIYGDLEALSAAGLIDNRFSGNPATGGYTFVVSGGGTDNYTVYSSRFIHASMRGRCDFYSGPDGVVHYRGAVFGASLPEGTSPGDPVQ